MSEPDWGSIFAAFGPVGGLLAFLAFALIKTRFLAPDTSRNEVLREIKETNAKIDRMEHGLTDRLARIETMQSEHSRRLDRVERN